MNFCNPKSAARSKDDEDFIVDNSFSSDYYNYNENLGFRTSSSSSLSMKWSDDARKQNEEDWLSIERIFYGEEALPEGKKLDNKKVLRRIILSIFPTFNIVNHSFLIDEKTREEFQCWMKAFPHLRVVGKKIEIPATRQFQNPINYYEEIIAIDPPEHERDSFKLLDQELNEKLSLRRSRQLSAKNQNLEKLLRITSSGISSSGRNGNFNQKESIIQRNKNDRKQHSNGSRLIKEELASYSATTRPPLLNVKFLFKKPENLLIDESSKVKSATSKLPLYELRSLDPSTSKSATLHAKNINLIQLPPFNSFEFRGIEGRSIQSAFKPNFKH